jgi:hypothetical protein
MPVTRTLSRLHSAVPSAHRIGQQDGATGIRRIPPTDSNISNTNQKPAVQIAQRAFAFGPQGIGNLSGSGQRETKGSALAFGTLYTDGASMRFHNVLHD